jgi:ribosomal protein S18 acetylase RimI-like enzyme
MKQSLAVRPAIEGDRATIATMLARAFAEDPVVSFMIPNPEARQRQLPRLFSLLTASDLKSGRGYLVGEGAAATLWRAPGQAKVGLFEMLLNAPALINALRGALPRALRISGAVEHRFPAEPFHYLHYVGCDPSAQGQGLGSAAIRAGLAAVPPGLPCYLETGNESNLALYQRFGFEVSAEWRVPKGPRFWSMRRPAA